MSKRQDDLRRLANDKSTTQGERDAARRALGEMPEAIEVQRSADVEATSRGLDAVRMQMPEWQRGESPHDATIKDFAMRMFNYSSRKWGSGVTSLSSVHHPSLDEHMIEREFAIDEFRFRGHHRDIDSLRVMVSSDKKIEIWNDRGWRDGPWWPRFLAAMRRLAKEADDYDAAASRKEAAREQAQRDAENDLFTAYAKKCG